MPDGLRVLGLVAGPMSYSAMSMGSHTFRVRAIDAAGNTDGSPATRTFTRRS